MTTLQVDDLLDSMNLEHSEASSSADETETSSNQDGEKSDDVSNGLESLLSSLFAGENSLGGNEIFENLLSKFLEKTPEAAEEPAFEFVFDSDDIAQMYEEVHDTESENAGIDLFMPED